MGSQALAVWKHTCLLLNSGGVACWGQNDLGQLGIGSTSNVGDQPGEMDSLQLVQLGTGRTAVAIAAGSGHTCALLSGGLVACWGRNDVGQLGIGSTSNVGDQPGEMSDSLQLVQLGAGRTADAIASGGNHNCVMLSGGERLVLDLDDEGERRRLGEHVAAGSVASMQTREFDFHEAFLKLTGTAYD